MKVISQPPPPLRDFGLRVPRPLEAILQKCLQKKPSQRYATAQALREDLQAFLAGQPVRARPPSLLSALEYQVRRHVLAATVSGTAAMLLLLLVGLVSIRAWSQDRQITELENEYDRLGRLVNLQTELMRGRVNQEAAALQLSEEGDLERASLFAALSILEAGEDREPAGVGAIITAYAWRHPLPAGQTESRQQLLARIIEHVEPRLKESAEPEAERAAP